MKVWNERETWHRIYLPEQICDLLKTFVDKLRKSVVGMNIYAPIDQPLNPQLNQEKVKIITEVYEAYEGAFQRPGQR